MLASGLLLLSTFTHPFHTHLFFPHSPPTSQTHMHTHAHAHTHTHAHKHCSAMSAAVKQYEEAFELWLINSKVYRSVKQQLLHLVNTQEFTVTLVFGHFLIDSPHSGGIVQLRIVCLCVLPVLGTIGGNRCKKKKQKKQKTAAIATPTLQVYSSRCYARWEWPRL